MQAPRAGGGRVGLGVSALGMALCLVCRTILHQEMTVQLL